MFLHTHTVKNLKLVGLGQPDVHTSDAAPVLYLGKKLGDNSTILTMCSPDWSPGWVDPLLKALVVSSADCPVLPFVLDSKQILGPLLNHNMQPTL